MQNFKKIVEVSGVNLEWKQSSGKKLRISISPKTAVVSVHIPKNYPESEAIKFICQNKEWIKKNKLKVEQKIKVKENKLILKNGSSVKIWGGEYKLKIVKDATRTSYSIDDEFIYIKEPNNCTLKKRNEVLHRLYKKELEIFIEEILPDWEQIIKEKATKIRYRNMKSKWGTCNRHTGIITLNTKLAEFPCECAEMVLVHEFVHFKERLHNARFKKYMTKYLPDWKSTVKLLNSF